MIGTTVSALLACPAAAQVSGAAELWGTQGADCKPPADDPAPWTNPSYSAECRARFVLDQFHSVDEKLRFLSPPPPNTTSTVRDVAAELHLPRIDGSDGPAGLVRGGTSTALPSPISVAASFDPAVARRYGSVVANEFRAAGLGSILGPAFDIARSWKFGRLSESMGEDPFLVATMSGNEVRALADGG
ncbi:MAG: glycoside hydrolase family 3 N-terminal domain-containing protein, partial [Croceibacterium sp.]